MGLIIIDEKALEAHLERAMEKVFTSYLAKNDLQLQRKDKLLTPAQAAAYYKKSVTTIWRKVKLGQLKVDPGTRLIIIP